jgi:hypothetical protein
MVVGLFVATGFVNGLATVVDRADEELREKSCA